MRLILAGFAIALAVVSCTAAPALAAEAAEGVTRARSRCCGTPMRSRTAWRWAT